jgi:hypothetical protein
MLVLPNGGRIPELYSGQAGHTHGSQKGGSGVTGRMRSDRSGSVRRLAGCNYGGSGGRVLIMVAMAAAWLN